MVEFEFAIKKNIVVGINSVNPEMWEASVLGGKERSVETTWHLLTGGGTGKLRHHSTCWELARGSL